MAKFAHIRLWRIFLHFCQTFSRWINCPPCRLHQFVLETSQPILKGLHLRSLLICLIVFFDWLIQNFMELAILSWSGLKKLEWISFCFFGPLINSFHTGGLIFIFVSDGWGVVDSAKLRPKLRHDSLVGYFHVLVVFCDAVDEIVRSGVYHFYLNSNITVRWQIKKLWHIYCKDTKKEIEICFKFDFGA